MFRLGALYTVTIIWYRKPSKKKRKQAGAELCQAQFKLGLALHALIGCKLAEI